MIVIWCVAPHSSLVLWGLCLLALLQHLLPPSAASFGKGSSFKSFCHNTTLPNQSQCKETVQYDYSCFILSDNVLHMDWAQRELQLSASSSDQVVKALHFKLWMQKFLLSSCRFENYEVVPGVLRNFPRLNQPVLSAPEALPVCKSGGFHCQPDMMPGATSTDDKSTNDYLKKFAYSIAYMQNSSKFYPFACKKQPCSLFSQEEVASTWQVRPWKIC